MEIPSDAIPHEMFENYHLDLTAQGFDYAGMQGLNAMLEDIGNTSIFNIDVGSPLGPDREWIHFNGDDTDPSNFECEHNPNNAQAQTMAIPNPIAPANFSDPCGRIQQAKFYDAEKFDEDDESRKLSSKETMDASQPKRKKTRTEKLVNTTKTMSDSLEDGFKWRKYGRKMLKSSRNPRSYHKCADSKCDVKKTVECDANDPQILITIYEGKHNHPSPAQVYLFEEPITLQPRIPGTKPTVILVHSGVSL